jgi:hypothetical protein
MYQCDPERDWVNVARVRKHLFLEGVRFFLDALDRRDASLLRRAFNLFDRSLILDNSLSTVSVRLHTENGIAYRVSDGIDVQNCLPGVC